MTLRGAFLVGCPRSGTTVLQSHLARHPSIVTFPESHFFTRLSRGGGAWRRSLGFAGTLGVSNFLAFVQDCGGSPGIASRFQTLRSRNSLSRDYLQFLNDCTLREGGEYWLEKTPGHSAHIAYIKQRAPQARFIHLVRDGEQVVPSLYRVTRQHSQYWDGEWSVQRCIERWRAAIGHSAEWVDAPEGHFFLFYDDLLKDPNGHLRALLGFLGLPAKPETVAMMLGVKTQEVSHVSHFESWKEGAGDTLKAADPGAVFDLPYSEQEAQLVRDAVASVDLGKMREAAGACIEKYR